MANFSPTLIAACACILTSLMPASAFGQAAAASYLNATRYDALGREVGTIAADPDGSGSAKYLATRTTYTAEGRVVSVETGELSTWKAESILPSAWGTSFRVDQKTTKSYNSAGQLSAETVFGSDAIPYALTQYTYNAAGALQCTAVRMNPAVYASLPTNACTLGPEGDQGPDRITRNIYDSAGQVLQVRQSAGTPLEQAYVTYSYTDNGKVEQTIDANGNRAQYAYDAFDRLDRWNFPAQARPAAFNPATPATAIATAGAVNTADYEQYTYDPNGNRLSLRKRDGMVIDYQYDALNRMTLKTIPDRDDLPAEHENDVTYTYDLRGLQTSARFSGTSTAAILTSYDGFGRVTGTTSQFIPNNPALTFAYDLNGNRTGITFAGTSPQTWTYAYDQLNRFTQLSKGATSLVQGQYNNAGQLSRSNFYSAVPDIEWTYDPVGRLQRQRNFHNTTTTVQWDFTRNPASQIASEARTGTVTNNIDSSNAYAWDGHFNVVRDYAVNGLNQYSQVGANLVCHDANGNLTFDGLRSYQYDIENRLVAVWQQASLPTVCTGVAYTGTKQAQLNYDPMGRLYRINNGGTSTTLLLNDGDALAAEYNTSGTLQRRYIHGPAAGVDDPLIWYESTGVSNSSARLMLRDPRGSIVNARNTGGTTNIVNSYDEYGIPGSANAGRFQYTGQTWIGEIGMYYYKARIYSPTLGRFLQTDPIGYEDNVNLYAYVGGDPVNETDPSGLCPACLRGGIIVVTAAAGCARSAGCRALAVEAARQALRIAVRIPITLSPPRAPPLVDDGNGGRSANTRPPSDAHDPDGAKAPGKPGEAEGFQDPPGGERWASGPDGRGGWVDADGNIWQPTGKGGRAHGRPHWDVQRPRGRSGGNVYPGGRTRPHANGR